MQVQGLPFDEQIKRGWLVCPTSHAALVVKQDRVETCDGLRRYPVERGVPLLLGNPAEIEGHLRESNSMVAEYSERRPRKRTRREELREQIDSMLNDDFRTEESRRAFESLFTNLPPEALCLSIGGGPNRHHPSLTNVNIGPFPNVDIVGDAHELPYRDDCVDRIDCQAVLEHLKEPQRAVREMFRVLKPGGLVYAVTPFLQAYHGYPNHFQNFTLTGHQLIFANQGFRVRDSGTCVGPIVGLWDLATAFIDRFSPLRARGSMMAGWRLLGLAGRRLDRRLASSPRSYEMASTTYVLAEKV
jgi:SAM-dependent methyltransferase